MRVLVVDDDRRRSNALIEHIKSDEMLGETDFQTIDSLDGARLLLKEIYFDILILDVVLPKRQNEPSREAANGLALLEQLHRGRVLKKPEKIIGITAHLADIDQFRSEFEKKCSVVMEAPAHTSVWKSQIADQLRYMVASRAARFLDANAVHVLTVHGIQTFGAWQTRLKRLVGEHTDAVSFHNYKYGYFSAAAFLVPPLRAYQVRRLVKQLILLLGETRADHLVIVAHSFGSYLIAKALSRMPTEVLQQQRITLILCGSVLKPDFDWSFLSGNPAIRVINECGDQDHVLWLSHALVLGTGMAGKAGFNGFHDRRMTNRFFKGGHSLYFEGDSFMRRRWVDLIISEWQPVAEVDERSPAFLAHGLGDQVVRLLGAIKPFLYIGGGCGLLLGSYAHFH